MLEVIARYTDGAGAWTVTREGSTLTIHTANDEHPQFTLTRAPEFDEKPLYQHIITARFGACDDWGVVWIDGEGYFLEGGAQS